MFKRQILGMLSLDMTNVRFLRKCHCNDTYSNDTFFRIELWLSCRSHRPTNLSGLAALAAVVILVDGDAALPAAAVGLLLHLLLLLCGLPQDALDVGHEDEGEAGQGAQHGDLNGVQHGELGDFLVKLSNYNVYLQQLLLHRLGQGEVSRTLRERCVQFRHVVASKSCD